MEQKACNAMHLLGGRLLERPQHIAFWDPSGKTLRFSELREQIAHAQLVLKKRGFEPGMRAVLFAWPSPDLFAWISAIIGLGGTVVIMEPWMAANQVTQALSILHPTHFLHDSLGWFWGARLAAVRKIPRWVALAKGSCRSPIHIETVDPHAAAMITFTTGSTGTQKGVVRTHATLNTTYEILRERTGSKHLVGPDLCIFSGLAMTNLASGRTTLLVSPWKKDVFKALNRLPTELQPVSLSTGPAFLRRFLQESNLQNLQHLDVGGAPCDCDILQATLKRWPQAQVNWVYGGTEVEPISVNAAELAIQRSREQGYYQVLYLGKTVPEIRCQHHESGLWVQGPHVSPMYAASPEENAKYKRPDADGSVWHSTGDRVLPDALGDLWYMGRTAQLPEHFLAEQKIYALVRHSSAFVYLNSENQLCAAGVNLLSRSDEIKRQIPEIQLVRNLSRIHYDRRHQARIDRPGTIKKEHL